MLEAEVKMNNKINKQIDLILFDISGVLLDMNGYTPLDDLLNVFNTHGVEIASFQIRRYNHLPGQSSIPELLPPLPKPDRCSLEYCDEMDKLTAQQHQLSQLCSQIPYYCHFIQMVLAHANDFSDEAVKIKISGKNPRFFVMIIISTKRR
jgi:hypothetical protein